MVTEGLQNKYKNILASKYTFLLILFFINNCCFAQYFFTKNYPKNYFSNPLSIPMQLSANFGELRNEHFHMGLDIRTNQKENLPIYASADGYISKIRIEQFGYGRAIYIKHPNGFTTLYAHLNNFYDTLECFVKAKQYQEEKWEQSFELEPNQFKVYKGQFIAFSGNTGGSQGPHLHFEIRDEKNQNINPLLFNFNIEDTKAPIIDYLYLYNRNYSTYAKAPINIPIKKTKAGLIALDSIIAVYSNKISFGIWAEDITNGSAYRFGIYQAEVWIDSILQFGFRLNNFSYTKSRYVNACIDYTTKYTTGKYIQHLSKLPGNYLDIFAQNTGDGVIELNDTSIKKVEIIIKDVAGNSSILNFKIQKKEGTNEYTSNTLVDTLLQPNVGHVYTKADTTYNFDKYAFYDTIPFSSNKNLEKYTNNETIPVHNTYTISLTIQQPIIDTLKNKYLLILKNNKFTSYSIVTWQDSIVLGDFDRFGTVQLAIDTIAPSLKPIDWDTNFTFNNQTKLLFHVSDNLTDIKMFSAELDGKWLMFSRKNNFYIYDFDENLSLGLHELKVTVEDQVGNIATKEFWFTKEPPKANKSKKKIVTKKKKSSKTKKRK